METGTKAIKFVKFFSTGVAEYQTYFTDTKILQNDGQTHEFADAIDAISKSTEEVFIFWDSMPIGVGAIKES